MYLPARSQRTIFEEIIQRKDQATHEWASENLDGTETFRTEFTHNGIGMRAFIRSIRAKELLERLHREVFSPGFTRPTLWLEENGEWSAWFGYSEPWPSQNYVRINPNWGFPNPLR